MGSKRHTNTYLAGLGVEIGIYKRFCRVKNTAEAAKQTKGKTYSSMYLNTSKEDIYI